MKKILSLLLTLSIVLTFAACAANNEMATAALPPADEHAESTVADVTPFDFFGGAEVVEMTPFDDATIIARMMGEFPTEVVEMAPLDEMFTSPDATNSIVGSWRRDNPDSAWHGVVVNVSAGSNQGVIISTVGSSISDTRIGDIKWRSIVQTSQHSFALLDYGLLSEGGAWFDMHAQIFPGNLDVIYLSSANEAAILPGHTQRWVRDGASVPRAEFSVAEMQETAVRVSLVDQGITNERLAEMVTSGEIPANVTHLELASNPITDISPLSGLTSLIELSLWGSGVTDLSPLSNLTSLTHLGLWGNRFEDLSPIADLTNLAVLALGGNPNFNGDLSVLRNLTQLTGLNLGDDGVGPMDFLYIEALVNLETFSLWGAHNLRDLSIFNNLENLQSLTIHASNTTDFSPLSNLTNLTRLELLENQISDISHIGFDRLTNLTELYLWNNQITDITPLSGLNNLTSLALGGNQINDVSPLTGLTGLRTLWLEDNQLSEAQIAELRLALPGCEIR